MSKSVFFLGIGGTLMGSLAILAKERGYRVSGLDDAIYPPMSELLERAGICVHTHFHPSCLDPPPDTVVMGNAKMARGKPVVEYVLKAGLDYVSGAEWLGAEILRNRHVIAVSGTHGKTTTTGMVVWILSEVGLEPGYLIGGVPKRLETSARLGSKSCFVVEADEYDTSFFDRRSKFLHYRPTTLVVNNLEYDHADIFPNLESIQDQFHHLLRAVPSNGLVIVPECDPNVETVLNRGIWTPVERIAVRPEEIQNRSRIEPEWTATEMASDGSEFSVSHRDKTRGKVRWSMLGQHNVSNALAAIAAAHHVGVNPADSIRALCGFPGIQRRMDVIAQADNLTVYDDFAHHPTAIRSTLAGLRKHVGKERIHAVIEPRTHTMSLGTLQQELRTCCKDADETIWFRNQEIRWDIEALAREAASPSRCINDIDALVELICSPKREPTHVVIMSNGGFQGLYHRIEERIASR